MSNLMVYEEDYNIFRDLLIKHFGVNNVDKMDKKELMLSILLDKVLKNIINCKKGDVIYKFNPYKRDIESKEEFIVFSNNNNSNRLLGNDDIIINNGNGYISGGLSGRAVLKDDWELYLREMKGGLKE